MPEMVGFLTPGDLHDVVRGMAVVCRLYDEHPDVRFGFDWATAGAAAGWQDFAGNTCHFLFGPDRHIVLGFDHESPMSPHAFATGPDDFHAWPGVYDQLPPPLLDRVRVNPFGSSFDPAEVTFCLWNRGRAPDWQKGDIVYPERDHGDPDGQSYILNWFVNYRDDFAGRFAKTYQWKLDLHAVAELLSGDHLTPACLRGLKPDCDPPACRPWLAEMGFALE